jgi:phytoene desaturase
VLTQSAYFRVANRCPGVEGLYFVGAGTHPGAGVPGVVNSAKATARLVIEDFAPARERQEEWVNARADA